MKASKRNCAVIRISVINVGWTKVLFATTIQNFDGHILNCMTQIIAMLNFEVKWSSFFLLPCFRIMSNQNLYSKFLDCAASKFSAHAPFVSNLLAILCQSCLSSRWPHRKQVAVVEEKKIPYKDVIFLLLHLSGYTKRKVFIYDILIHQSQIKKTVL